MKRSSDKNGLPTVRCAIYTRKSTEEGLDSDFNSLDAQRESGEAYIKSQQHEGWVCLPERYDDGGYTGGNLDRPALKRLLADIDAGKVNCVIVYKVDRLSRSLLDFGRIMEAFDTVFGIREMRRKQRRRGGPKRSSPSGLTWISCDIMGRSPIRRCRRAKLLSIRSHGSSSSSQSHRVAASSTAGSYTWPSIWSPDPWPSASSNRGARCIAATLAARSAAGRMRLICSTRWKPAQGIAD